MSYQEQLSKHTIAISVSESPDMRVLGLAKEHLDDAMAEVARYLLAKGARLVYGGDLRSQGFTEVLFELVSRHGRDADAGDERVGVRNFLAWPVHISLPHEELAQLTEALSGVAELVCLTADGNVLSPDERRQWVPRQATADEWSVGLTSMRAMMTRISDARVVLGGKINGFKGRMPGVAEEALSALRARQPLFILGGFGGCSSAIAVELGLTPRPLVPRSHWSGSGLFTDFTILDLNNSLDPEENRILATTVHVDQAVTLILRGLTRKK